jgi:hypothetical protein
MYCFTKALAIPAVLFYAKISRVPNFSTYQEKYSYKTLRKIYSLVGLIKIWSSAVHHTELSLFVYLFPTKASLY